MQEGYLWQTGSYDTGRSSSTDNLGRALMAWFNNLLMASNDYASPMRISSQQAELGRLRPEWGFFSQTKSITCLDCPGRDSNPGRRLERPAYSRHFGFDRTLRPCGLYTTGAEQGHAGLQLELSHSGSKKHHSAASWATSEAHFLAKDGSTSLKMPSLGT